MDYVVPIIGVLIANFLFMSPLKTILRVDSTQQLGDLNPLPYPLMVFHCAGWVIYGLNFGSPTVYFLFLGNFSGLIGGIYFSLVSYPLAPRQIQVRMRFLFVALPFLQISLAYFLSFSLRGSSSLATALGFVASCFTVMFFGSPLSSIFQVLRTKSAASIHTLMAVASAVCTLFCHDLECLPDYSSAGFPKIITTTARKEI